MIEDGHSHYGLYSSPILLVTCLLFVYMQSKWHYCFPAGILFIGFLSGIGFAMLFIKGEITAAASKIPPRPAACNDLVKLLRLLQYGFAVGIAPGKLV